MTGHDENNNPTVPVYTVSHCSPKTYRIYFGEDFDKFGIDGKYYQQIQVKGDTLLMNSFDATNGNLYDCIKIVKKNDQTEILDCGKDIPENLNFSPAPGNKKDMKYMKRINEYKQRRHIEL
jgi:hypothetical protein